MRVFLKPHLCILFRQRRNSMTEDQNNLWVDKYCPNSIKDMVLTQDLKEYFNNMINSKNLINMTFLGPQGCGKTTICKTLAKEFNASVLFLKCSVEGTVDVAKTKLQNFCDALSIENKIKVVILDELDSASATQDSSFQKTLRNIIESSQSNTRFLITSNFNKIIAPVISRCPIVPIRFEQSDLLKRLVFILDSENIKYTKDNIKSFVKFAFRFYPDCRRIINLLQSYCTSGTLVMTDGVNETDKEKFYGELCSKIKDKNFIATREFVVKNKALFSNDYLALAEEMFEYMLSNNIIDNPKIVFNLADSIYQINMVVNKEIGFMKFLSILSI